MGDLLEDKLDAEERQDIFDKFGTVTVLENLRFCSLYDHAFDGYNASKSISQKLNLFHFLKLLSPNIVFENYF